MTETLRLTITPKTEKQHCFSSYTMCDVFCKMKIFVLIALAFSQPAPDPNPPAACDVFTQVCPNAECEPPQQAGQILFQSPTDSDYQYLNKPINITFSYSQQTDPQYIILIGFRENSFWFIIGRLGREIGKNGPDWGLVTEVLN